MRNKRSLGQRGFSMLELMMVLVIVGIVLRFVMPGFQNYRLTLVENQTKSQVLEDLRAARQKAITRHVSMIIAFGNGSTTTNLTTYKIHTDTDGDKVLDNGEPIVTKSVARDSKFSRVTLTPTDTLIFDTSGLLKTPCTGGKIMLATGTRKDTLAVSIAGIIYKP